MWTNVVATAPTEPNLRKAREGGAIIGRRDRPHHYVQTYAKNATQRNLAHA